MEQMASQFERDIQSREIEKRSLGMKITKLQEELNANKNHFSVVGSKLEKLKMKYEAVKKRYKSKSGLVVYFIRVNQMFCLLLFLEIVEKLYLIFL